LFTKKDTIVIFLPGLQPAFFAKNIFIKYISILQFL